MVSELKYKYTDLVILITLILASVMCYFFVLHNNSSKPVNFIDGDARYYYYYLQSTFISPNNYTYDWLNNGANSVTHHPVGISIVLLPFFLIAYFAAYALDYPINGVSEPFQISISIAAIFYCIVGLIYIKKLFKLNNLSDGITALLVALVFFGTNLYHYTITQSVMSHVYSFCFMSVFMYHSCKFIKTNQNKSLIYSAIILGIIVLIRANNVFIILSTLFWFKNFSELKNKLALLFKNKQFYYSLVIFLCIILVQPLIWHLKENHLFSNRYAPYGFYWLKPEFIKMLFGFDSGFFIYTPLCFLFLFGLIFVYLENKFLFFSLSVFILVLFYFFSAYCAYTYYDGLGIRVLVDYYAVFAFLGGKLFTHLLMNKIVFTSLIFLALFCVLINQVYSYQIQKSIILYSGMNFKKWKYTFLKTGKNYENCLGGSNDLTPYSQDKPKIVLSDEIKNDLPFNYSNKDFGICVTFDSIGFNSKRIQLKINVTRQELYLNSSKDVLICGTLCEKGTNKQKSYFQFKLNETPSTQCCKSLEYNYSFTSPSDYVSSDCLLVYIWNINKQPFLINKFSVQVFDYNY